VSEHNGSTENGFADDDWRAVCSCGWQSDAVHSEAEATTRLVAHYASGFTSTAPAASGARLAVLDQIEAALASATPEPWALEMDACGCCDECRHGSQPTGKVVGPDYVDALHRDADHQAIVLLRNHGATFLTLARAIRTVNAIRNLGDQVYGVRERELKGWDGPQVKAYGAAVAEIERCLKVLSTEEGART
jgi:hypothetical protein